MATSLTPPISTIVAIKSSIQDAVKTNLPPSMLAYAIAPLLTSVNQWSTQIPIMLAETGTNTSINLVFSIRKDLYNPPGFSQNTLGLTSSELPGPFQDFQSFCHKLMDAQQKSEKPPPKVSYFSRDLSRSS